VFHQNAKGIRKGERRIVGDAPLPLDQAARFQVFHTRRLDVAVGEVLRITRNGMTKDKKHSLNNGQLVKVKRFDESGNLVLANGWVVSKDFGHLAYGYVVTSHASQGRTVDRVFIGQSSASLPASSREQFYVSVSRGKERATIYTDDKQALLDAVKTSDNRLSATELERERSLQVQRMEIQREVPSRQEPKWRELVHVR
jgi:UvrD-like helicase C-terminal domain